MKRGAVSLVFDDGYASVREIAIPLLKKYGIKATFGVAVEQEKIYFSEKIPVATLSEWKETCLSEGHELAAHGVTHSPLAKLPKDALEKEIIDSRAATGAKTIIYPGGSYSKAVEEISAKHFLAGRTTVWGMENLPPTNPLALKTINATKKNFSVWKWNIYASTACLNNKWLIETYHRVSENPNDFYAVSASQLEQHLRFLKKLPMKISTIGDII